MDIRYATDFIDPFHEESGGGRQRHSREEGRGSGGRGPVDGVDSSGIVIDIGIGIVIGIDIGIGIGIAIDRLPTPSISTSISVGIGINIGKVGITRTSTLVEFARLLTSRYLSH